MKRKLRAVRVQCAPEMLGQIFVEGKEVHFKVDKGLPIGAHYLSSFFDEGSHVFNLIFVHDSFDEVPFGELIPPLETIMTRLDV